MVRALIAGTLGFLVVLAGMHFVSSPGEEMSFGAQNAPSGTTITVDGIPVNVTVADTVETRAQGLSGMSGLAEGTGMLFVFTEDGHHAFWMKDMLFSIDILWISHEGDVVHIERDVTPETYPGSFRPSGPARYVLEVPAGFSQEHNISLGSKADFSAL